MSDRATDLVIGLQRMADNARIRGVDLRYSQQQATYDHLQYLDQLLDVLGKARDVLIDEREKFLPAERSLPALQPGAAEKMPRVVAQGPKAAQS